MEKLRKKQQWPALLLIGLILTAQSELALANQNIQKGSPSKKLETLKSLEKKSQYDISLINSPYSSWGIQDDINLKNAWSHFTKKSDVVVAVIDTGIDYQHSFLKNNIVAPRGPSSSLSYGVDFSKNAKDKNQPFDSHGHGTHIAGIIKSIMPDVKILPLKYYNPDADDSANLKSTIEAIEYAVTQGVDIINYSSGGQGASAEELQALKKAEDKGILVVAAAGNRGDDIDQPSKAFYPASYNLSNIVTVINHDQDGQIGPSSNFGKTKTDISAPGTRIRSTFPNDRSSFLTGTSQATAFVSGVAALIRAQNPDLSYREIKEAIISSALTTKELKDKCLAGGRLDASQALLKAEQISKQKGLNNSKKIASNF